VRGTNTAVGNTPIKFDDGGINAYYDTTRALGVRRIGGNGIPFSDFNNHFMLCFALTADLRTKDNAIRPELIGGKLRVELDFDNDAIAEPMRFIIMGEKKSVVYIDHNKVVVYKE
jgi:hypothetical protein